MSSRGSRRRRAAVLLGSGALVATAMAGPAGAAGAVESRSADREPISVIPAPRSMREVPGEAFEVGARTVVVVPAHARQARGAASALTEALRPSTGYELPVVSRGWCHRHRAAAHHPTGHRAIRLKLVGNDSLGREGYRLDARRASVQITAHTGAGLFHGVQTLLQLLPGKVLSDTVQSGPWVVPGVHIADTPRFPWRGAMLDVARHFFSVAEVERYIDLLAQYKINVLHLHLSDDRAGASRSRAGPGSPPTAAAPRSTAGPAATTPRTTTPRWSTTRAGDT
jgi:hexosaminidase